jgi:CRP-like cAMP-binding protein
MQINDLYLSSAVIIITKSDNMFEILAQTALFRSLPSDKIEELLDHVDFKVRKVERDDLVGMSGDVLKGIYIVIRGSVRGEMLDFSGKAITIENIKSPNLLAPAFLFGKKATLPVDIIANEKTELFFISKANFVKLMQLDGQILSNFLDVVSGRTQFLAEKINFLSFKTIREKYLHFIISYHKKSGLKKFSMKQTQAQLSELFGVSRPALAKVIAELNEEGVLSTKGKEVEIIDVSKA